jgi:hypothetical protein
MIERVTNVRYPKDVVHEPLRHLRDRAKRPPKGHKYVGSSSAAPSHDDMPAARSSPPPPRRHRGSMIKRVLKSIFSMCKTIATETNENRRDIIEIKSHLGLPTIPTASFPSLMTRLRNGTPKVPKKKKRRREMMKNKKRRTMTLSDSAAPHFLFGA